MTALSVGMICPCILWTGLRPLVPEITVATPLAMFWIMACHWPEFWVGWGLLAFSVALDTSGFCCSSPHPLWWGTAAGAAGAAALLVCSCSLLGGCGTRSSVLVRMSAILSSEVDTGVDDSGVVI